MTTIATHPLLAQPPYELSAQEYVDALTAFSHVMHGEHDKMHARLLDLSPQARVEVQTALSEMWGAVQGMVRRDTPLPEHVEGFFVAGATR